MAREYEVIAHPQLNHINAFLVRMVERRPHIHRDLELGMVLEGSVTLKTNRSCWLLEEKDIYLINPMESHEFASDADGALLLDEIAKRENLSLTYLSHFFKDALGEAFQEYLNQKRFEYACHLLATTDRKILDISLSSGFSDVRYFNRTFQKQFGCTPRDYRQGKNSSFPKHRILTDSIQYFFAPEDARALLARPRRGVAACG